MNNNSNNNNNDKDNKYTNKKKFEKVCRMTRFVAKVFFYRKSAKRQVFNLF